MQDEANCTEPTTKNSIWKSHSRSSWNGFWGKIVGRQKKRCITCTEKNASIRCDIAHLHLNHFAVDVDYMNITRRKKNKHLIQEIESKRIWKELLWAPSAWIWRAHMRRSTHRHRCRLKLMHKYFTFLHVESTISIVQNIKISGNIISTMVWRATLKSACPCVCLCFKCDSVRHLCVCFCVVFFVV